MSLLGKDRTFSSLENFLEWMQAKKKETGYQLEDLFNKGLDATLTIAHYTTMSIDYTWMWARYSLSPFPGCCGIVVSHNAYVWNEVNGFGLGQWFLKQRQTLMKVLGYSCAIATVTSDNSAEKHILTKNGWTFAHSFVNSRTGNTVEIWVKNL